MSNQAKINEKFRGDYLAVNIRETDIYEEGRNDGIHRELNKKLLKLLNKACY